MTYFNTTHESGATLQTNRSKAESENKIILAIFQQRPNEELTPPEVHNIMILKGYEPVLTSVRRAITTLTKKHGKLLKSETKKAGIYGRSNYTWKLKI